MKKAAISLFFLVLCSFRLHSMEAKGFFANLLDQTVYVYNPTRKFFYTVNGHQEIILCNTQFTVLVPVRGHLYFDQYFKTPENSKEIFYAYVVKTSNHQVEAQFVSGIEYTKFIHPTETSKVGIPEDMRKLLIERAEHIQRLNKQMESYNNDQLVTS